MRHRCDSRIINYLTLMTLKTPEMTGTKSKFRSKFRFRLDSVPATGRNFAGILNLGCVFVVFHASTSRQIDPSTYFIFHCVACLLHLSQCCSLPLPVNPLKNKWTVMYLAQLHHLPTTALPSLLSLLHKSAEVHQIVHSH
jgi:hypothetical protein